MMSSDGTLPSDMSFQYAALTLVSKAAALNVSEFRFMKSEMSLPNAFDTLLISQPPFTISSYRIAPMAGFAQE
jgi:hypothetical protein